MANIVITGVNGYIKFVFNDSTEAVKLKQGFFNSNQIAECVELDGGGVVVTFSTTHGQMKTLQICYDGVHGEEVDTVDAVEPTSDTDLCDKIGELIKS